MKKKVLISVFTFLFLIIFLSSTCLGVTIVLDSGHGGKDPGSINQNLGLYERNQVWKITNYLKGYLEEYKDTKVYMTYPKYTETGDTLTRARRSEIMKNYNADLGISLHIDSSTNTSLRGATAYVSGHPKFKSSMTKLGNNMLANLSKLGIKSNGVQTRIDTTEPPYEDGTPRDYYAMLMYPTEYGIPAILFEHCYISNSEDCKFIDSDEDLKKIAKADADAIANYLKLVKKSDENTSDIDKTYVGQKAIGNYLYGDINKDGKVDTKDARLALLNYVGKEKLTDEQKLLGDVNKDNKVDTKDARQILLFYVGKIK
ncbi:MAG: hypothetical protein HFJ52_06920 [Clostridia bacterium]|nr:hypothetical protein [Clostridia bacterium]